MECNVGGIVAHALNRFDKVAYYCLCADVSIGCVMFRIAIGILAHWFIVVNVVIVY